MEKMWVGVKDLGAKNPKYGKIWWWVQFQADLGK